MEPQGSLQFSKEPTTGSYPEPDKSSRYNFILFSKIHFSIIFLPKSRSYLSLSFWLSHRNPFCIFLASSLSHAFSMPYQSHPLWLHNSIFILRSVQILKFLYAILSSLLLFHPSRVQIFSSAPCSSLNVTDQVSQSYKTTGKIKSFYIIIFRYLDSRREGRKIWTEWCQELPEFVMLLISSWIKFWFVTVYKTQ
jgi:hypothetical protein